MNKINVAIDGPAAAGKSTVAKRIADQCSYVYIDTGAMYRALTYQAFQVNVDVEDERKLISVLQDMELDLKPSDQGQLVFINEQNVTEALRSQEVTNHVSIVAKHGEVRQEMVKRQKELAEQGGVVMDGRDIGTHVLPKAEVKVFLLASVEERAKRRHEENLQKGFELELEKLIEEIAARDKMDMEREVAPLKKADDAVEIDTTSLTIDEVVEKIVNLIHERIH